MHLVFENKKSTWLELSPRLINIWIKNNATLLIAKYMGALISVFKKNLFADQQLSFDTRA